MVLTKTNADLGLRCLGVVQSLRVPIPDWVCGGDPYFCLGLSSPFCSGQGSPLALSPRSQPHIAGLWASPLPCPAPGTGVPAPNGAASRLVPLGLPACAGAPLGGRAGCCLAAEACPRCATHGLAEGPKWSCFTAVACLSHSFPQGAAGRAGTSWGTRRGWGLPRSPWQGGA